MRPPRGFASDNYAGALPEVLRAVVAANTAQHAGAYGDDDLTERLQALTRRHFGECAVAFPVFNGTAANVVSLLAACPRHAPAVICAVQAHIQADEGGAPEVVAGLKLHLVATPDGKLTPSLVEAQLFDRESVHRCQAGAVSITNATELSTVYTAAEVRALADVAHAHGLLLHLDGARISNAAAALGCSLRAFTSDAGVDVVSFGGTKIGCLAAEAVIVLNPALLPSLPFLRKTNMQLCSKQRFLSAQLIALLQAAEGDDEAPGEPLCVRMGMHANAMAARLLAGMETIPGVVLPQNTCIMANAVFPILPPAVTAALHQAGHRFYVWDGVTGQVRFMCSWDTTAEDVDAFVAAVRAAMAAI
jgi:threonine aldolase